MRKFIVLLSFCAPLQILPIGYDSPVQLNSASQISALIEHKGVVFAGTWGNGVYFSVDRGESWSSMNTGLKNSLIYTLTPLDSILFAGTEGEGILACPLAEMVWKPSGKGLGDSVVFALARCGQSLMASTWQGGVYRSGDAGRSWSRSDSGIALKNVYALAASRTTWYAGTAKNGLYSLRSDMDVWEHAGLSGMTVVSIIFSEGKLWVGTWSDGIFVFDESTRQWQSTALVPGAPVTSIIVRKEPFIAYCAKRHLGVFESTDFGFSCRQAGLQDLDVFTLVALDDRIIAGTWGHGVFIRYDSDTGWVGSPGTSDIAAVHTANQEKQHFIASDKEQHYSPLPVTRSATRKKLNPGLLRNVRVCPSGKLVVCFSIQGRGPVAVALFDRRGKPLNRSLSTAESDGKHTTAFDARLLRPGIYFITLRTQSDYAMIPAVYHKRD